jgi:hypothetical protein
MWTYQALIVFMILLLGFITRTIIGSLVHRKKIGDMESVIESFIFSFLIYLIILFIYPSSISEVIVIINDKNLTNFHNDIKVLLIVSMLTSIFLGLIMSIILNHDYIHNFLRWSKVTTETSRESTWLDIFLDMKGKSVVVTLDDDRRIEGYPAYYSHDQEEGCIFLTDAYWIDDKNETIKCEHDGILLTKYEKIKRIEFLKTDKIRIKEK